MLCVGGSYKLNASELGNGTIKSLSAEKQNDGGHQVEPPTGTSSSPQSSELQQQTNSAANMLSTEV